MLPIPLFRASESDRARIQQADILSQAVGKSYYKHFGSDNIFGIHKRRHGTTTHFPVVCVSVESGFWSLHCNDPEITREQLQPIVDDMRLWEHARAFASRD